MNDLGSLLEELGVGVDDLPIELRKRLGDMFSSPVPQDLYVTEGDGFTLRLVGLAHGNRAKVAIMFDGEHVAGILEGRCNPFALYRLAYILRQLSLDVIRNEEAVNALFQILSAGEEVDEAWYDLITEEMLLLVPEAFRQQMPEAVVEFALAHPNMCRHHVTDEVARDTIDWDDRFREFDILSVEEAEGLAAKRKLVTEEYIGAVSQPGVLILFYQWLTSTLTGSTGNIEIFFQGNHQEVLEGVIMEVEERKPHLSFMVKIAIMGGLLWDTFAQEGEKVNLMSLTQGIDVILKWMVTTGYLDASVISSYATQAIATGYTLSEQPKVNILQYGPW